MHGYDLCFCFSESSELRIIYLYTWIYQENLVYIEPGTHYLFIDWKNDYDQNVSSIKC